MKSNSLGTLIWIFLFGLLLYCVHYQIERNEFALLFLSFSALFGVYYFQLKNNKIDFSFKKLIFLAVGFRSILLFAEPNLSDDYFRFFWDGTLALNGVNPYAFLPKEVLELYKIQNLDVDLFNKLNSPNYYSVYPPFLQILFFIGAKLSGGSLWLFCFIQKIFLIIFEAGSISLIYHLAQKFRLNSLKASYLYAFNPLVIIELTGNLHYEALLIFFSLLGIYFITYNKTSNVIAHIKILKSAGAMSMAFASKLIPLIFLPFLIKRIGFLKSIAYGILVLLGFLLLYLPFLDYSILHNIFKSTELYYQKFEFNASIYYVFRWIGYQIKGWNTIAINGKILAFLTLAAITSLAFFERKLNRQHLVKSCLFALLIYFALANIVHPWYVCSLVAFGSLTKFRFPIIWSFMVVLSYTTYMTNSYTELLGFVALEYLIVYGYLFYELTKQKIFTFS